MNFMLVLQWRERRPSLDRLVELESGIENALATSGITADCDGHDTGPQESNIFVLTPSPEDAFAVAHRVVREADEAAGFSAAFRPSNGSSYRILWPATQRTFRVS